MSTPLRDAALQSFEQDRAEDDRAGRKSLPKDLDPGEVEEIPGQRDDDHADDGALLAAAEVWFESQFTNALENVLDLLTYYPRNYLDRTNRKTIKELAVGEPAVGLPLVVN